MAVAFLPAVAALVLIEVGALLGALGLAVRISCGEGRGHGLEPLLVLGNGFVLTALLWASAVASYRRSPTRAWRRGARRRRDARTLFGIVHSPRPDGAVFWPWAAPGPVPFVLAGAYGLAAGILLVLAAPASPRPRPLSGVSDPRTFGAGYAGERRRRAWLGHGRQGGRGAAPGRRPL